MPVQNPDFTTPTPGLNPGRAQFWTHAEVGALSRRFAGYAGHMTTAKYWGAEEFEGGWSNDDGWTDEFSPGDTVEFPSGPETFEDWVGYAMEWLDEFELGDTDPVDYNIYHPGDGHVPYEAFESKWDNDFPYIDNMALPTFAWHFREFEDGAAPTYIDPSDGLAKYVIGSAYIIRLWLGKIQAGIFIADMPILLTPGTYTKAAMRSHLQSKTNAALIAAGAPFGSGDLTWKVNPYTGGLRVSNTKGSDYYMILASPAGLSAWTSLGFAIDDSIHHHPIPADVVEDAVFDGGMYWEPFDLFWNNYLDEVLWHLRPWVDAHDAVYPITIQAGINDALEIYYDDRAGLSTTLALTLTPGVYANAAAMAVEVEAQVNAALTAYGPPLGPGDIDATTTPDGEQVRIINNGGPNMQMWLAPPAAADGWDDLGFDVEIFFLPGIPDQKTRRLPDLLAYTVAQYDTVPGPAEPWENFEDNWIEVLP